MAVRKIKHLISINWPKMACNSVISTRPARCVRHRELRYRQAAFPCALGSTAGSPLRKRCICELRKPRLLNSSRPPATRLHILANGISATGLLMTFLAPTLEIMATTIGWQRATTPSLPTTTQIILSATARHLERSRVTPVKSLPMKPSNGSTSIAIRRNRFSSTSAFTNLINAWHRRPSWPPAIPT